MAQRSTQIANRIRNAEDVVSSARTHRDTVAATVAQRMTGLDAKQIRETIAALADHLEAQNTTLGAAEDKYVGEQADDPPLRSARDAHAAKVSARVVNVRTIIEDNLGAAGLDGYGLEVSIPRSPKEIESYAQNSANLLRKASRKLDDGLGKHVTTRALGDSVAEVLGDLTLVLGQLRKEHRELEAALTDRDRAVEAWTDAYQGAATALEGFYRLAGRHDLADRIRPTERRAAGQDLVEPDPGEPATPVDPTPIEPT